MALPPPGVPGGGVVRVLIAHDPLWRNPDQSLVQCLVMLEGPVGVVVVEVAQVMAEERLATMAEGERRLELAPDGEDRPGAVERQRDRPRGVPAGPPHWQFDPVDHPGDRVVAADVDRAV